MASQKTIIFLISWALLSIMVYAIFAIIGITQMGTMGLGIVGISILGIGFFLGLSCLEENIGYLLGVAIGIFIILLIFLIIVITAFM